MSLYRNSIRNTLLMKHFRSIKVKKCKSRNLVKLKWLYSMRKFLRLSWLFAILAIINIQSGEKPMNKDVVVVFETTQGVIEFTLKPDVAPKACENFVKLIESNYYDGIIFHRVIKDFMIQGGDPTGTGRGGKSFFGKPFEDECTQQVRFDRAGILAMANAGPSTNGSQFFITTTATPWLNMRHTIFGEVTKGMDVVKKIETTKTGAMDRPVSDQKIIKAYVKS